MMRVLFTLVFTDVCDESVLALYNYKTGALFENYLQCPTTYQIASYQTSMIASGKCSMPNINVNVTAYNDYCQTINPTVMDGCYCFSALDLFLENSCCRKSNSPEAIIFQFLYALNAILLWARLLHFFEQNETLGPLLKIMMTMINDLLNYIRLTVLFGLGFALAMITVIGDWSGEFYEIRATLFYMFKSTFGKIDFVVLEACGDSVDDLCPDDGWIPYWRSNLAETLMSVYLVIALILIRLLIAMV